MSIFDQSKLNQQNHFLSWNGNIADDLLLVSVTGEESMAAPFRYELCSLTNQSESVLTKWHGKPVSCQIGDESDGLPQRSLHGIVTHIHYRRRTPEVAECILTLEPSIALLKMGQLMQIWQNISVPDLVETLLKDHGIEQLELQLHGNYTKREYCVQYRESTFDFIQRLLGEEGIYFFFRHSESEHKLVLADNPASHSTIHGDSLSWHHQGNILTKDTIDGWVSKSSLLPGSVSFTGVNMPQATSIEGRQSASQSDAQVNSINFVDITPQGEREMITRTAQQTMAAREANVRIYNASVNAHWLCSGETFTLTDHPSDNGSYHIQSLSLDAANNFDNAISSYNCQVQAVSTLNTWHPPFPQRQECPGIQSATVVGPKSEEIHTDEYGRIKIQFPWDKKNKNDENSSCWVRVAQPWSGNKFGCQFIPRVGSEVLVSFVQGDSDYPLVIGTLYNGQNKPPFPLPAEKNESGFVTRSTTGGSVDDGHRLSFNDKKGEELLTIVAQKDLSLKVKNDATSTIAANRSTEITKGNDQLVLKQGDVNITLEKGNWQQKVTGNLSTELKDGDYALKVAGGSGNLKTDKALVIESAESIELKVGSNKIMLSTDGISISGSKIQIDGNSSAELTGALVTIESKSSAELKGKVIAIQSTGPAEMSGKIINITADSMTNISGKIINIG